MQITTGAYDYDDDQMWTFYVVMLRPGTLRNVWGASKEMHHIWRGTLCLGMRPPLTPQMNCGTEHGNAITMLQRYPRAIKPDQAEVLQQVGEGYEHVLRSIGWLYTTKTLAPIPTGADDDAQNRGGASTKGAAAQGSHSSGAGSGRWSGHSADCTHLHTGSGGASGATRTQAPVHTDTPQGTPLVKQDGCLKRTRLLFVESMGRSYIDTHLYWCTGGTELLRSGVLRSPGELGHLH